MENTKDENNNDNDVDVLSGIIPSKRRDQSRVWFQGGYYLMHLPDDMGVKIRAWGGEPLFVTVARYEKVKGKTLTIEVPGETPKATVSLEGKD